MQQRRPGPRETHDDEAHVHALVFDLRMAGEPVLPLQPCRQQSDDPGALACTTRSREARLMLDRIDELREWLAERSVTKVGETRALACLRKQRRLVEPHGRGHDRRAPASSSTFTTRQPGCGGSMAWFQRRPMVPCV